MSARGSGPTGRSGRRLAAAALAVLTTVLLAGCQRPVPEVRLVTGGSLLSTPADAYCFTAQQAAEGTCRTRRDDPPRLRVEEGEPVGIEVPAEVAARPWVVRVSGVGAGRVTTQTSDPQLDRSYLSITPAFGAGGSVLVEVLALGVAGTGTPIALGRWQVLLVRR